MASFWDTHVVGRIGKIRVALPVVPADALEVPVHLYDDFTFLGRQQGGFAQETALS